MPRRAITRLRAACRGNTRPRPQRAEPSRPGRWARAQPRRPGRERRGESRDGSDGAGLDAAVDERLGADEDVEAGEEIGLERLPRSVADLEADEVRGVVPRRRSSRGRSGSPPCVRTRRRRTGAARRPPQRRRSARAVPAVEREVRRADHGDGVAPLPPHARRAPRCRPSSGHRSGPRQRAARRPPRRTTAARAAARRPRRGRLHRSSRRPACPSSPAAT